MNQVTPPTIGKLICIVGIDGAGKTTLINSLKSFYSTVLFTREPGGTAFAEDLRNLLFSKGSDYTPEQQMRLFFLARQDHIQSLILPAVNAGKTVISDRFDACTFAYQRPDQHNIETLFWSLRHESVSSYIQPHYVWLKVNVDTAIQREAQSLTHNHFDKTNRDSYLQRIAGYEQFFSKLGRSGSVVPIDASGDAEETFSKFFSME